MTRIPVMADKLPPLFLELLGEGYEVLPWDTSADSDSLRRAAAFITYSHPRVDGPLLDRAPNVKVVSNHGVGVDHIDVAAANERNIPVGNTPGCLDGATADMTFALILATARNIVVGDHYARSSEFTIYDPSLLIGKEVHGSTLGIVGLGRIGKQVARRACAFDMRVLYHNRRRDRVAEAEFNAEFRTLDDLLAESDFVALNCPLTEETTNLISTPQFERMQRSAVLINMSRGAVVDTDALYAALTTGRIAAAGIDVTQPEPLPREHPLLKLNNLVLTPHLGSASGRTRRRMIEMSIDNLRAGLAGQPLPTRVG
jgi:glyoxylate reductase